MSPAPRDLKVLTHSVDLILHTLTVPSEEALKKTKKKNSKHSNIIDIYEK